MGSRAASRRCVGDSLDPESTSIPATSRLSIERWALCAGLFCGAALLAYGLLANELLARLPLDRIAEFLIYAAVATALAWVTSRLTTFGFFRALIAWMLGVHFALLGLRQMLGGIIVALVALAIGSFFRRSRAGDQPWLMMVTGLGVVAGVIGWTLPWPVHRRWVYWSVGIVLVLWRRKGVAAAIKALVARFRETTRDAGWEAWLAAIVIGYAAGSTLLPTSLSDDLSYHLAMPWQLATLGHYRFDVQSQVWAVSPWAADVIQSVAQLIAGVEARGAVNTLYILASLHLLFTLLAGAQVPRRWRWLGLALFASQPLWEMLGVSMQSELPTTAVLLALAIVVQRAQVPAAAGDTMTAAVLAAFAIALKASNVVYAAPLVLVYLVRARERRAGALGAAILAAAFVGASSYVYAWVLTGNPILPLMNGLFRSPYFAPVNFEHPVYIGNLTWDVLYRLTFNTSEFVEGGEGTAGFQWLALAGALLISLRQRQAWPWLLAGVGGTSLLFVVLQYLRYVFPGLALATVPLVLGLRTLHEASWARLAVAGLVLLNIAFFANGIWFLGRGTWQPIWEHFPKTEQRFLMGEVPERVLASQLRERHRNLETVLLPQPDVSFGAEFAGRALTLSWYDPQLYAGFPALEDDLSGQTYTALFDELGISHVLARQAEISSALAAALAQRGNLEQQASIVSVYRIRHAELRPGAATSAGARGAWHARYWLPDRFPQIVDLDLAVDCRAQPMAVKIVVSWLAEGRSIASDTNRKACSDSGLAGLARHFPVPPLADEMLIDVEPDDASDDHSLSVRGISVQARPDVPRLRDLSGKLRFW